MLSKTKKDQVAAKAERICKKLAQLDDPSRLKQNKARLVLERELSDFNINPQPILDTKSGRIGLLVDTLRGQANKPDVAELIAQMITQQPIHEKRGNTDEGFTSHFRRLGISLLSWRRS